nr:hypothetical protein [Tanacetum cinerariifolium]
MEAVMIIDVLRRAKAEVVVASVGSKLEIVASRKVKLVADMLLDEAAKLSYDLIEMEAVMIIDVLRRAKAEVVVASVGNKLEIVASRKVKLVADMLLDEAAKLSYDLIVLPGGLGGAQAFADSETLVNLLKKQSESDRYYGAICASPALVLEPHGLLKGKKATAFPAMCREKALEIAKAMLVVEDFLEDLFLHQPSGNPTFSPHPELTSPEVNHDIHDSEGCNDLANLDDNFVDPIPEMFTDEHTPDYSSPPMFDEYEDDFLGVESESANVNYDPFDSKEEKIKEIFRVDVLPLPNNEDKVFNPGILIQEKPVKIITRVVQNKKLVISNASLVHEDFDPPFYEPLFFKEVPKAMMLLLFSSENKEKVFKPGIYTSEKVKDNKENDKIETKPDKIKSKREAWKSPTKSKPSHSKKRSKPQFPLNYESEKGYNENYTSYPRYSTFAVVGSKCFHDNITSTSVELLEEICWESGSTLVVIKKTLINKYYLITLH